MQTREDRWSLVVASLLLASGCNRPADGPKTQPSAQATGSLATAGASAAAADSEGDKALAIIRSAKDKPVSAWSVSERLTVTDATGPSALVGLSRDAVVAALGQPERTAGNGAQEWTIGKLGTSDMNPAPVLVLTFDAAGDVATAGSRLGM